MRDIAAELRAWQAQGVPAALATVVDVRRSAPRRPGAALAVTASGEVAGSVSGGCVEGAVYEEARRVLGGTAPPALHTFGFSDEQAFAVGLTCGGELDIFVEPLWPGAASVLASLDDDEPVAVATVVAGRRPPGGKLAVWQGRTAGTLGSEGLDVAVVADARGLLAQGQTGIRHYGPNGERRRDDVTVFVQSLTPRPRMLVFGAIDYAAAVAEIGAFLGYRVTVCDAREVFATTERFPHADEVVVAWPHRYLAETEVDGRTVICVLTHDPKFDVPLLEVALRSPAAYVGAMGSRRTHAERFERLREAGLTDAELERLRSPVGLDLGARTPEETAVSVAAELIQQRWGGSGRPLRHTSGPIHDRRLA